MGRYFFDSKLHHTECVINGKKTIEILPSGYDNTTMDNFMVGENTVIYKMKRGGFKYVKLPMAVGKRYSVMRSYKSLDWKIPEKMRKSRGFYSRNVARWELMKYSIEIQSVELKSLWCLTEEEWIQAGISKFSGVYYVDGIEPRRFESLEDAWCAYCLHLFGKIPEYVYVYRFTLVENEGYKEKALKWCEGE